MRIVKIASSPTHPRYTPEDIAEIMSVIGPNLMEDPTEYNLFDEEIQAIPEVKEAAKAGWIKFLETHPEEIDSVPEEFKSDPRLSATPQDSVPAPTEAPVEDNEPVTTPVSVPKKKSWLEEEGDLEKINAARETLKRLIKTYSTDPTFKKRFKVKEDSSNPGTFKVQNGEGQVVFNGDVFGALKALRQLVSKNEVAKHIEQDEQEKQKAFNALNFSVTEAKPQVTGKPVDLGMTEEEIKEMSGKKYVPRIQDQLATMRDDEE